MPALLRLYGLFLYTTNALSPAMMLVLRLSIAHVFWASGILKAADWDNTLALFTYEHPVPYLPVPLAAFLGTAFEIICPVLIAFGVATRAATLPLIVMTLVINYTYLESMEHIYWLLILGTLLCKGAGKWSVDALIYANYHLKFRRI